MSSSFKLGRLFDSLDRGDGPMLSAGRGSMGSLRAFSLPFIPEEVAAAGAVSEGEVSESVWTEAEFMFSLGTAAEGYVAGEELEETAPGV